MIKNSYSNKVSNRSLTILFIALIPLFSLAQTEINNINTAVLDIKNNLSTFIKIEKANTNEGTTLAFVQKDGLKLITVKAIEPTIEKQVEWYYINGQLAYCETNWVDLVKKENIFNEKCYLQNNHLISWTNSHEKIIDPLSEEFKKMDADLVAYGKRIKDEALR